jgi:hypothetical protein
MLVFDRFCPFTELRIQCSRPNNACSNPWVYHMPCHVLLSSQSQAPRLNASLQKNLITIPQRFKLSVPSISNLAPLQRLPIFILILLRSRPLLLVPSSLRRSTPRRRSRITSTSRQRRRERSRGRRRMGRRVGVGTFLCLSKPSVHHPALIPPSVMICDMPSSSSPNSG